MNEQEAKTKWCPMVRTDDGAYNRQSERGGEFGVGIGNWNKCVASDCMMWVPVITVKNVSNQTGALQLAEEDGGYCGLSRK